MSGAEDARALRQAAPSADAVADYLRHHPDFLVENPELIALLTPPEARRGERVVDMQKFMLDRLRAEVAKLAARERSLLSAAESSVDGQNRVQQAVLAALTARSFRELIEITNTRLPRMLGVTAIVLAVESEEALPGGNGKAGVRLIKPGTIDRLLGGDSDILLVDAAPAMAGIFTDGTEDLRAHALARLDFGPGTPAGLLALGSDAAGGFHPDQATGLLSFFCRVMEHCIRQWLAAPK